MGLVGVRFEDTDGFGVDGYLPLRSLTVLFGRNGVGKTRYLEHTMAMVDPTRGWGRSPRSAGPSRPAGRLFVTLDEPDAMDGDFCWLRRVLVASHDAVKRVPPEVRLDVAEARNLIGEEGQPIRWDRPDEVAWAKSNDFVSEEDDDERYFHHFAHRLSRRLAREALGDDHDPEDPLSDLVSFLLLVARPTISLQNQLGGLVGVAYDPLGLGHHENGDQVLPAIVEKQAADAVERVPGSVLGRAGERILEPGDEARELFTLAVLSKEIGEFREEEGSGIYVFPWAQVVEIPDQVGDPERQLDEAVSAEPEMRDGWFTETDQGMTRVSDAAAAIVQEVEDVANRLLPTFVLEQGRVQVNVVSPANWTAGQPRVAIGFNLGEGNHAEFSMLGAGTRRWVAACVAEAHRRWYGPPAGRPALFVVDEPELHLHPTAQHDIGVWLTERAAEGHRVLVATHSPAILHRVGPDADILGVARNQSLSTLVPIGGDLLDSLSEFAEDFGVEASVWLQLTRAVLVVEGEHDKRILEAFFGAELDRSLVRILALRGTGNALALIDSDFLGAAGIPLRVMFDAVRPGAVTGEIPPQHFTPEETKLGKVLEHLGYQRLTGHDVAPVPYTDPDVICALPASAVRRAFPEADFPGWDTIIDEWSNDTTRGFKKFAISMTGLNGVTPDEFVDKVLAARDPSDEPAPTLTAAVASLLQTIR